MVILFLFFFRWMDPDLTKERLAGFRSVKKGILLLEMLWPPAVCLYGLWLWKKEMMVRDVPALVQ